MDHNIPPFWKSKQLEELNPREWDALCDGCARCCLIKLEEEDSAQWHLTRLACKLLDCGSCRCSDYDNRHQRMPDCVAINPQKVRDLSWLPDTCAYRVIQNGGDLAWWHPLVSGSSETVHEAGISVRGWARSEEGIKEDVLQRYIIKDYPNTHKKKD